MLLNSFYSKCNVFPIQLMLTFSKHVLFFCCVAEDATIAAIQCTNTRQCDIVMILIGIGLWLHIGQFLEWLFHRNVTVH